MKKNIKKCILAALAILIGGLLAIISMPLLQWFSIPENRDIIWHKIDSLGPWGIAVFLSIQVLQVVIAFIPGEPVELAAGLLYGTWGGLLISLAGVLIGSSLIFAVVRQFGRPLVHRLVDRDSFQKYAFLSDARKLDTLIFLMFLMPGTPKDTLNYLCPLLTPISPARFLVLSTFARIPSIISSTFAGATFAEGNLIGSLIVLVITSIIGLLGIRYEPALTEYLSRSAARFRERMNGGH